MDGQAPGLDQHGIEAQVAAGELRVAGHEKGSGLADAQPLSCAERFAGQRQFRSRFDFDEGNQAAASGHDVDFASR